MLAGHTVRYLGGLGRSVGLSSARRVAPVPRPALAPVLRGFSSGSGERKSIWKRHRILAPTLAVTVVGATALTYDQFANTETRPEWLKPKSISAAAEMSYTCASRFAKCCTCCVLIIADYKWSRLGMAEGSPEFATATKEAHGRCAARLANLFLNSGGVFIKAGQQMYALDYLLPEEYWKSMLPCLGQVPYNDWSDVQRLVEGELGRPIKELFSEFDEKPIASASLAQVHHAVTKEGVEVAVKVQYPDLLIKVKGDLWTIETLLVLVEKAFPEFKLGWLAREFNVNLPKEMDFLREGSNAERTSRNMESLQGVRTPYIMWPLTTKRVLTMEFIHGCYINDLDAMKQMGVNKDRVAWLVCSCIAKQIFIDGFAHCDPHPGNILARVLKDGSTEIVLLDHGLYREVDDKFRLAYAKLWMGVLFFDKVTIAESLKSLDLDVDIDLLACMLTSRDWVSKNEKKEKLDGSIPEEEVATLQKFGEEYMFDIADVLAKCPEEMLLLFKCNDLMRSVHRQLKTNVNLFALMADYTVLALKNEEIRLNPSWSTFLRQTYVTWAAKTRVWLISTYMWIFGIEI